MRNYKSWFGLRALFAVVLIIFFLNCSKATTLQAQDDLQKTAASVLKLIKLTDFKQLSKFLHPKRGVEFFASDASFAGGADTIKFSKKKLIDFMTITEPIVWGYYEGRGDDIKLTPEEYYKQIMFDYDYEAMAKSVIIEKTATQMPKNFYINYPFIFKTYPNATIVHYYYKGSEKNNFMDYRKLTLIFEKIKKKWFLIAIWSGQEGI